MSTAEEVILSSYYGMTEIDKEVPALSENWMREGGHVTMWARSCVLYVVHRGATMLHLHVSDREEI